MSEGKRFTDYTVALSEAAAFEDVKSAQQQEAERTFHDEGRRAQRRRDDALAELEEHTGRARDLQARARRLVGLHGATTIVDPTITSAGAALGDLERLVERAERDAGWLERYRAAPAARPEPAATRLVAPPPPAQPPAPAPAESTRRKAGCGAAAVLVLAGAAAGVVIVNAVSGVIT